MDVELQEGAKTETQGRAGIGSKTPQEGTLRPVNRAQTARRQGE